MRRLLVLAAVFIVAAVTAGAIASAPGAKREGVPSFGHVFVIIGENTELSQVTANNAPYLMGTFKPKSAWLTGYFATTHYSEANTSR